jgi:DNA-directed RNA polymerase subunit RPC12/RpoP
VRPAAYNHRYEAAVPVVTGTAALDAERERGVVARYRERLYTDWKRTMLQLIFFGTLVCFAIFVIEPRRGFIWAVLFVLGGSWIMTTLFMRQNAYRCAKCKRLFQAPTAVNFVTPSAVAKNPDGTYYSYKNLACPHCGTRGKARVVTKGDMKKGAQLLGERPRRRR